MLWFDNLYWQRFGTDPIGSDLSQNVTAMAVLVLDEMRPSKMATRQVRFPAFTGHLDFPEVLSNIPQVMVQLQQSLGAMQDSVNSLSLQELERTDIRVPLDVRRPRRTRMQWRPFNICEQQVGRNADLLVLLLDLLEVQDHSQQVLPVLCDENIHYRLLRLM